MIFDRRLKHSGARATDLGLKSTGKGLKQESDSQIFSRAEGDKWGDNIGSSPKIYWKLVIYSCVCM